MSRMKEGEEEKTKSYTALVWTQRPIQEEDITFIDDIKVNTNLCSVFDTRQLDFNLTGFTPPPFLIHK